MDYEANDYGTIRLEQRGAVAVLTLNRPDSLNAISVSMRDEVADAIGRLKADDAIRAMVLTGAGRGFCSGADLTAPVAKAPADIVSQNERLDEMRWIGRWATMWLGFDKPVVGAINGVAAGAGMATAIACDVRIGSELTRFKSVYLERAISPESGISYFLPRIVGYSAAADILFTCRAVDADEALRLGLLNRLAPSADLVEAAISYAQEMARWPPLALRVTKRVLQTNTDADFAAALRYETTGLEYVRRSPGDLKESRDAFFEKRPAVFTGA